MEGERLQNVRSYRLFQWQLVSDEIGAKFYSSSYKVFFKYLLDQIDGPIILVQDGARYQISKDTPEFMELHQQRLFVFRFPSYFPDYNKILIMDFQGIRAKINNLPELLLTDFRNID